MKFSLKLAALTLAAALLGIVCGAAFGQTHSSATITQVVAANPAIPATVTIISSPNPSTVGKLVTYSGTVTGTNNGANPTGTVTVVGITGTQTVTIGAGGSYSCSETPATPTSGFKVTATFNGDVNFY